MPTKKTLGEPDAGNLQVRFDEGALETGLRLVSTWHEAGNGGYWQDRPTRYLASALLHPFDASASSAQEAQGPPSIREYLVAEPVEATPSTD